MSKCSHRKHRIIIIKVVFSVRIGDDATSMKLTEPVSSNAIQIQLKMYLKMASFSYSILARRSDELTFVVFRVSITSSVLLYSFLVSHNYTYVTYFSFFGQTGRLNCEVKLQGQTVRQNCAAKHVSRRLSKELTLRSRYNYAALNGSGVWRQLDSEHRRRSRGPRLLVAYEALQDLVVF